VVVKYVTGIACDVNDCMAMVSYNSTCDRHKNDTEFNCNEAFIVRQVDTYTLIKPDPSLPPHINAHKRKIFPHKVDNLSICGAVLMECVSGRSHVVAEVGQDDRDVQVMT